MVNKKGFDLLDTLEKVIPRKTAEELISYIDSEHEQKIVREVERRMEHLATKEDLARLEAKIDTKINRLDDKIERIRQEIEHKMNTQFYWVMGGIISILIAFIFK